MDLTPQEQEIKDRLDAYLQDSPFSYNPDPALVQKIIKLLEKNRQKHGEAYCPCRMVTGMKEADKNIICPCRYHEKEIRERGMCHCRLFVPADNGQGEKDAP